MWALKKQIGVSLVSPKENIAGGASLHFCSKLKRGGLLGISAKPSYRKHILENVIKEIIKHRKSLKSGDLDKQKFLSLPYRIRCLIPPQSNKLSDESSLKWTPWSRQFSIKFKLSVLLHLQLNSAALFLR